MSAAIPLLKATAATLVALLIAQYLAAHFFLWSLDLDPRRATPLTIAQYAYHHAERNDIRQRLISSSIGALALVALLPLIWLWPRRPQVHGDARFSRRSEIRAAGLLGNEGIILGRLGRRCLMLAGQQGVALAAPPRAGKGTGLVIPNALNWAGSLVCIDIKRENWTQTAGYRYRFGQAVHLFDPFADDGRTAHWNPFHYVAADATRRVNDLQRIADMLYPDPPHGDPFWTASARSLFLGIALYLFETPSAKKTIGEVLRQGMASDDEGFGHHWRRVIESRNGESSNGEGRNAGHNKLSSQCVRSLYDVIDLAPSTASSIRKTFTSRLDLWLNPILDAATSGNDFDLRELRTKPMSIYVAVNPDDLHRLRPVLSLFFQQAIGLQTRELPERNPALKHQVLMLLDEFAALGRIPIIAEAISYLPGYNVRVVLVIQTPAQLREVYGSHNTETMLKSLAARIVFAPKDHADAQEISNELGNTTAKVATISKALFAMGNQSQRPTQSVSLQRRSLLLPQEVKELGAEEAILFYEGLRPIRCRKIRYHRDARFMARVCPPPIIARREPVNPCTEPTTQAHETLREASSQATREATLADLDRLEQLTVDDYPQVQGATVFPADTQNGPLTPEEMSAAADRFIASFER